MREATKLGVTEETQSDPRENVTCRRRGGNILERAVAW